MSGDGSRRREPSRPVSGGASAPKGLNKSRMVSARLPIAEYLVLEAEAKAMGMTVSALALARCRGQRDRRARIYPATNVMAEAIAAIRRLETVGTADPHLVRALQALVAQLTAAVLTEHT